MHPHLIHPANLPPWGKRSSRPTRRLALWILLAVLVATLAGLSAPASSAAPRADAVLYADALDAAWQDWSYNGIQHNFANASPVHAGSTSIAVTYTGGWSGLQLGYHGDRMDISAYDTFRFWIHGGTSGGQTITFQLESIEQVITPPANAWTLVEVDLNVLGNPRSVYSISWFNNTGGGQPVFYLDDLAFTSSDAPTATPPSGTGPALAVNVAAGAHPISPYIYGMNFASPEVAAILNLPVRRWGGNSTSRYNWQNNFTNTGSDWYYENVSHEDADDFVGQDHDTGTETILTMPLIGWVSKNSPSSHPFACGFKISKYGAQQANDWEWDPDCGNGKHTNGTLITGNDPLDTSIAVTAGYATGWVNHLVSTFGTAANGGVQFYNLDNEPMLWNSTHRDVHPAATTYDEMRTQTWAYAAAIKAADPSARTLGPVTWGWCAYFYSAADGCSPGADRQAHGNMDFTPWYLQQMQLYEQQHGVRLLDYLDLHIYPQIDDVYSTALGSASIQAARLRSTRQLWDPTYTHEGWIGQPVYLIPRMKQWVAAYYPGTKLAITEYNWGALGYMNGALAQADLLGIFGREGLDLATLWGPPTLNQPALFAFRMYRNYDGQGHTFGQTSVQASSGDQEKLAIYAALRSPGGVLTLMVVNKTASSLTSTLTLQNFAAASSAQVYRYSPTNLAAILRQADQAVGASGFSASFPPNSITLFILPPQVSPTPRTYLPVVR